MSNNGTFANEFQNRELEMRDPKKLLIVTEAHLKKYPDNREQLAKYYDLRADAPLDAGIATSVKQLGAVHTALFITSATIGDETVEVIIAGRQRARAAIAAGIVEVPVIVHSDEDKLNALLELSENLGRRQNTVRESAYAYRKALQSGLTQDEIAGMVGVTPATITYALTIGDMPKIVHQYIEQGKLTETAALQLAKTFGKKAPKGSGLTKIYDNTELIKGLEALEEQARLAGGKVGGKIKVKQAKASKAGFSEGLTKKEWEALVADENTPDDYKALIKVFVNQWSVVQARTDQPENLDWLRKITPQPKPKKVKEPKVEESKKSKTVETPSDEDLSALFA